MALRTTAGPLITSSTGLPVGSGGGSFPTGVIAPRMAVPSPNDSAPPVSMPQANVLSGENGMSSAVLHMLLASTGAKLGDGEMLLIGRPCPGTREAGSAPVLSTHRRSGRW